MLLGVGTRFSGGGGGSKETDMKTEAISGHPLCCDTPRAPPRLSSPGDPTLDCWKYMMKKYDRFLELGIKVWALSFFWGPQNGGFPFGFSLRRTKKRAVPSKRRQARMTTGDALYIDANKDQRKSARDAVCR